MSEIITAHQNPKRIPFPKKDIHTGIFVILFGGVIYLLKPAITVWLIVIPIYFSIALMDWYKSRSMNVEFYFEKAVFGEKHIPYHQILRIFKTDESIIVVSKSKFFTKRFILYNPSEEIRNLLRDKFRPTTMNSKVTTAVKISTILIYMTSGMSLIYFIIFLTDAQISKWISISFFVNAFLLLISTNLYFWLHIRFEEYVKLD